MTAPRLPRLIAAGEARIDEAASWAWMPRYIALRLADPSGSPLAAMARAKAETEARAA